MSHATRRALPATAAACLLLIGGRAHASGAADPRATIRDCIEAAARAHAVPPAIVVVLLDVEGGALGEVSPNTNHTVDIGPMQVNQIWLPRIAAHWNTTPARAFLALRDSFCASVEAGTWILRQGLDEANGDFWEGVGFYHSHDPGHRRTYLRAVLRQILRLRTPPGSAAAAPTKG
jgi:hypothetical protein